VDGVNLAGFSSDKVHDLLKKAAVNNITMAVRDRPFERTLTLHKDSTGHIGFQFKDGKITSIVVDSSAARFLTPSRTQFCNFPHKYFYPLLKYFHLEGTGSLLTTSCWR
jgi:hypothetical protein